MSKKSDTEIDVVGVVSGDVSGDAGHDKKEDVTVDEDETKPKKSGRTKIQKPPVQDQLDELYKTMKECSKTLTQCASAIKSLSGQVERERKQAISDTKKGKNPKGPGNVSSFENAVLLSDEMCEFLGLEKGSRKARNDVKAEVRSYIRDKELQNPDNKRQIIPDKKLKKILHNLPDDVTLDYWNMETYLKPNFIKETIKKK